MHVHVVYIVFIAITYYLSLQVYNLWSDENLTYPGGIKSNSVISFGRRQTTGKRKTEVIDIIPTVLRVLINY